MPDIDRIILALRLGVFADDDEDSLLLIDDEDLEGVVSELSGENFTTYSDEDLYQLSLAIANESVSQIFESLHEAQRELRAAVEVVEVIEMFQNQEPDWEI